MRTILVDDEPVILEELKRMFKNHEKVKIVGAYTDPLTALRELSVTRPDCAFLDIEMFNLNGIELAEKLMDKNPDIQVLFITAYNHYATQAFEVNAIDYILKPVRPERLAKALEKIFKKMNFEKPLTTLALTIQSFGNFEVFIGDKPVKWPRAKPRELFAYLLQSEGKWVEKYKVCDDLWREQGQEQALANLQTGVWAIRKALNVNGCKVVEINYSHNCYQLLLSAAEWDLQQFDIAFNEFTTTGLSEKGRIAKKIYTGEYLNDEDWPWADLVRESYTYKYKELERNTQNNSDKDAIQKYYIITRKIL